METVIPDKITLAMIVTLLEAFTVPDVQDPIVGKNCNAGCCPIANLLSIEFGTAVTVGGYIATIDGVGVQLTDAAIALRREIDAVHGIDTPIHKIWMWEQAKNILAEGHHVD